MFLYFSSFPLKSRSLCKYTSITAILNANIEWVVYFESSLARDNQWIEFIFFHKNLHQLETNVILNRISLTNILSIFSFQEIWVKFEIFFFFFFLNFNSLLRDQTFSYFLIFLSRIWVMNVWPNLIFHLVR